ncbi:MAG TPA: ASKHA domain-containing protein [Actinomycetota bacterium]|nr:ASKHA domain-containing protein [Actinomycetota bacterium]
MSGKIEVTYLPTGTVARVPRGTTVFNAAHWAGLPIESTCGGRGTCGKCGVRIVAGEAEATPADHRHLADRLAEGWRLSCQCELVGPMTVEVPRLQSMPRAATMGVGRFVLLEPNVVKVRLELPPPSLEDPRSHVRRVIEALDEAGHQAEVDPDVLPVIAATLQRTTDVTATLVGAHLVNLEPGDTTARLLGASFDIGTTTCVCTLVDLVAGAPVAVASTLNRQAPFGADVIARMARAMQGPEEIEELRGAALATVAELLEEVCADAHVEPREIAEAVVVGNATMLHLLVGVSPESIALAPYVPTFTDALELRADRAGFPIHPCGWISLFPAIGAYVGADIVADILATGLARDLETRLLVDVGTNGEIACGNAERSVATAAPAGPAFEGGEIAFGMRATDGAIEGVMIEGGEVRLQVIGGGDPTGICGSGLVDAVAQLRLAGLLDDGGKLLGREAADAAGHPLAARLVVRDDVRAFVLHEGIVLTQADVRALQFAKGAISTGIETAMRALDLVAEDLDEVLLAGSFGAYIDPQSARVIGLVPPVPVERIRAVGNTASEGAKMALLSFREREVAAEIPAFVEYIELSGIEDFNDRFIGNLGFPPLASVTATAGSRR